MRMFRDPSFRLALIGLIVAMALHFTNGALSDLPWGIHATADDASYLRPAENWLHTGHWKDNSTGASASVQRPPLFGIIHGFFYLLFSTQAAIATLFFFFFVHAIALYRLPRLLQQFVSEKASIRLAYVYALTPCFWGFLSYQITEAISPSLVILLLAALFRPGTSSFGWSLFYLTCLWFLRPVLLLLFPVFLYVHWQKRRELFTRSAWWNPVLIGLSLLLVFSWEARKAHYMGSWGQLHPIYHASNQSVFRPVHASLTAVFRVWETRPEVFHAIVGSCWSDDSTLRSLTSLKAYVAERHIPLSPEELHQVLSDYHTVNLAVRAKMEQGTSFGELPQERFLRKQLDWLAVQLESEHALQYHVLTPARSAAEQLKKSQLNLELFQVRFRGNVAIEALRYFCVTLILLLVTGSLFNTFSTVPVLRWIAAGVLFYCFYLFYVQRLNEDRYLIPLLPVLFVGGAAFWWKWLTTRFRSEKP